MIHDSQEKIIYRESADREIVIFQNLWMLGKFASLKYVCEINLKLSCNLILAK